MKALVTVAQVLCLSLLLVEIGCKPANPFGRAELSAETDNALNVSVYIPYTPAKIDIMPLTEFVSTSNGQDASKIRIYVSLLDAFDCQIKSPVIFRFELYEYVRRSAEPKGRRIVIWPDIDLTGSTENNNYWRDFLRAYKFNLDFEPAISRSYILQITSLCPNGKRLSAEFTLKHTK